MSIAIEEIARNYVRYGAKRLGIEDRLNRFTAYIKSLDKSCARNDVVTHYVDSVFLPILENSEQLAVVVNKKEIPRYYRNRFTRALSTRDKAFIRWFLRNYVMNYTDVDAVVSNNYQLLPCFFGFCFFFCPIGGGTCASNASATCLSITELPNTPLCCSSTYYSYAYGHFNMVDNAPWISSYSSGDFGISAQVSSSAGTYTLTGSFKAPSCFPSSGVTLNLDLVITESTYESGTCASSCPSGSVCVNASIPYCPGTTYSDSEIPVLYYGVNQTVLPNSSYSVWWSVSVS